MTVRHPVLEVEAAVEPFENARGHTLRVHRVAKPRGMGSRGRESGGGGRVSGNSA